MGYKQLRVSDISGRELTNGEAVTVVVKGAGKVFDAHIDELAPLKGVNNVVELEYRYSNGETKTALVTKTEFNKLITDEQLAGFDSSRGRRSGYSPRTAD